MACSQARRSPPPSRCSPSSAPRVALAWLNCDGWSRRAGAGGSPAVLASHLGLSSPSSTLLDGEFPTCPCLLSRRARETSKSGAGDRTQVAWWASWASRRARPWIACSVSQSAVFSPSDSARCSEMLREPTVEADCALSWASQTEVGGLSRQRETAHPCESSREAQTDCESSAAACRGSTYRHALALR
eukprot:766020-Hanusia_phi.AAC.2